MSKKTQRKLDRAADQVPLALQAMVDLRQALDAGKPLHVLLGFLDEAQGALLGIEDQLGVRVPATLFDGV